MPNHFHSILTASTAEGLSRAVGATLHRLRQCVGARDRTFVSAALRFGRHGRGSSLGGGSISRFQPRQGAARGGAQTLGAGRACAHASGQDDALARVAPPLKLDDLLALAPNEEQALTFETKSMIWRPLGSSEFLEKAEAVLGRAAQRKRPGAKPKAVVQYRSLASCHRNSRNSRPNRGGDPGLPIMPKPRRIRLEERAIRRKPVKYSRARASRL